MNRGRSNAPIFHDNADCQLFLDIVGDAVGEFGVNVHAYALMPNHYHLLVQSVRGNLSAAMRHLGAVFTQRSNKRHGRDGALFRGRFQNQYIADESYLRHLLAYIHLNPVAGHLVSRPDEPSWTSHRAYLGLDGAPPWLTTTSLQEQLEGPDGVDRFVRDVHCGTQPWPPALDTASGWLVDGEATRFPARSETPAPVEMDPDEVERAVCEVTGETPATLRVAARGPRANPARRFAVWALRRQTKLSHSGIGRRLEMSSNQVAKVLARLREGNPSIADWQDAWRRRMDDADV